MSTRLETTWLLSGRRAVHGLANSLTAGSPFWGKFSIAVKFVGTSGRESIQLSLNIPDIPR